MNQITVIYHSADFDGIFCREIARKFLGDQGTYIGWNFGDQPLAIPEGGIYVMDLPVDRVFGFNFAAPKTIPPRFGNSRGFDNVVWIDHHKSSIAGHPTFIPGYRIDGVAACRLAWQWFDNAEIPLAARPDLPEKVAFVDRGVTEPYAVQLAGEYDVWDKRNPAAAVFQFGLRSKELTQDDWKWLLTIRDPNKQGEYELGRTHLAVASLVVNGQLLQRYQQQQDARVMERSCLVQLEGLTFLALNSATGNSLIFESKDVPETGHDALMLFCWLGGRWNVSLYHAKHRTDIDLSAIAVKYGGGGHRGACGFRCQMLSFLNQNNLIERERKEAKGTEGTKGT